MDLSRLAPLATEWQVIEVWRKWCFWQAHSESIQNFHNITTQNLDDASYTSNKMEEKKSIQNCKTFWIDISAIAVVILGKIPSDMNELNLLKSRGSGIFFFPESTVCKILTSCSEV